MADDYGIDVSTIPDLSPAFALVSGRDALVQCLVRRLRTPRGSLPFHPDDGICLSDWLHEGVTQTSIWSLQAAVETELRKDERVQAVSCSAVFDAASGSLSVAIRVTPVTGRPFRMTASVSDFDFSLLSVE